MSFEYRAETSRFDFPQYFSRELLATVLVAGEFRDRVLEVPEETDGPHENLSSEVEEPDELEKARAGLVAPHLIRGRPRLLLRLGRGAGGAMMPPAMAAASLITYPPPDRGERDCSWPRERRRGGS